MTFNRDDILLAIKKDTDAFGRIYNDIYLDLYKMAFYILGNKELAEDAVADTFLDAYKGVSKIKDSSKFENWILKILTSKCKQMLKNKYNKFTIFNSNARSLDDFNITLDNSDSAEDIIDVRKAMEILSTLDRIIVSLCIVEGYKSNEVGEILSMKPTTVRSRLNRSLSKLKNFMEVE